MALNYAGIQGVPFEQIQLQNFDLNKFQTLLLRSNNLEPETTF